MRPTGNYIHRVRRVLMQFEFAVPTLAPNYAQLFQFQQQRRPPETNKPKCAHANSLVNVVRTWSWPGRLSASASVRVPTCEPCKTAHSRALAADKPALPKLDVAGTHCPSGRSRVRRLGERAVSMNGARETRGVTWGPHGAGQSDARAYGRVRCERERVCVCVEPVFGTGRSHAHALARRDWFALRHLAMTRRTRARALCVIFRCRCRPVRVRVSCTNRLAILGRLYKATCCVHNTHKKQQQMRSNATHSSRWTHESANLKSGDAL